MSQNNGKVDKDQERAELHRTIWKIADDLRGSVDGWDFKQYILGTLFYRFISENLTDYINAEERRTGTADFDYAKLSDKEAELRSRRHGKGKGVLHTPERTVRERQAQRAQRCRPERDTRPGLQEYRKFGQRHRERRQSQGPV